VTFRYRDNRSQQLLRATLTAEEFIRRFLLHTLPLSFAKVRYYGLFSPAAQAQLALARALLNTAAATPAETPALASTVLGQSITAPGLAPTAAPCLFCHLGQLRLVAVLPPQRSPPPKVPP
jgi:Putative transposase